MNSSELLDRISNGEDSNTQFKKNINNTDKLAEELVAFSNSKGGLLIIGVDDAGYYDGLSSDDVRRLNQLIGNVINANVNPPIYPLTTIQKIDSRRILIIEVDEGQNKPYSTNKGFYLTKAGSDKRKISPEELRRLFAESKRLFADEEIIIRSDITDLNSEQFLRFLKQDNKQVYDDLKFNKLEIKKVLELAKKFQVKKFVYAASSSSYGLAEQIPTSETAPIDPQYPFMLSLNIWVKS